MSRAPSQNLLNPASDVSMAYRTVSISFERRYFESAPRRMFQINRDIELTFMVGRCDRYLGRPHRIRPRTRHRLHACASRLWACLLLCIFSFNLLCSWTFEAYRSRLAQEQQSWASWLGASWPVFSLAWVFDNCLKSSARRRMCQIKRGIQHTLGPASPVEPLLEVVSAEATVWKPSFRIPSFLNVASMPRQPATNSY